MTIVKDPPKDAVIPEVSAPIERKDSRRERPGEFGAPGFGNPAIYQGERSLVPQEASPVVQATSGGGKGRSFTEIGLTRREATFLKALAGSESRVAAWRQAFPKDRCAESQKCRKAGKMYRRIIAKVGEDEIFEVMGIGKQATMEKLRQLKDAKVVKAFIVPETGQVVEAGPYADNTTQFNTTKLLTQINRMVPDEKGGGGGAVVVNIISYNPPGTKPWPGGGRA